jgi:hypothetical protein
MQSMNPSSLLIGIAAAGNRVKSALHAMGIGVQRRPGTGSEAQNVTPGAAVEFASPVRRPGSRFGPEIHIPLELTIFLDGLR